MHYPLAAAVAASAVFTLTLRTPAQAPPATPPNPPAAQLPPSTPPPPSTLPAAPAKDPPPNVTSYPTEIAGRKLEEWIKDIDSPDPSVRETAIKVVVQFGPSARRAIPALVRQVRHLNDLSPQASAIIALSELVPLAPPTATGGPPDGYTKDAVEALTQALDSTQAIIRFRAATALAWIGPPSRTALHKLMSRIDDRQSWEIRKAVCVALGTAGRDENGWPTANVLEALGRGAGDREATRDVRIEALQAIVNLGPPYAGPPPQLVGLLKQRLNTEKDKSVLIWVRVAFMRLDPAGVTDANVTVISKQLAPKPGVPLEVRVQAAKALGFMGPLAKPGLTDMIEALQTSDQDVLTVQLCWSLARMGQYGDRAVPALKQVEAAHKDDKNPWVRDSAKVACETIETAVQKQKAPPPPPPLPPKPEPTAPRPSPE